MNNPSQGIPVDCPNCGHRFGAILESIIDGGRDPNAKARFLSGRTNVLQCPNCGTVFQIAVPLVYHDGPNDLLIAFFPQELNYPKEGRERIMGEMTRAIMNSLPQEERRGYLFNPVTALTLDGMIEMVLEKDGITKEMIDSQREKGRLVETFLMASSDTLADLILQHDAELDDMFFQMMTLSAEMELSNGNANGANQIIARRDEVMQQSSYGQDAMRRAGEQDTAIQEVMDGLNGLGQQPTIEDFLDLVERYADSDDHLQALVGLTRPSLDYNFFLALEQRIKQVEDQQRATKLDEMRERLLELANTLDQQQQALISNAQNLLRDILNAEDVDDAIEQRLGMIDDLFLGVLGATIQSAEQNRDLITSSRLKTLQEKLLARLQASAPPEVQFINQVLQTEDQLEARLLLSDRVPEFGETLIYALDALVDNLSQRGGADHIVERLLEIRDDASKILSEAT